MFEFDPIQVSAAAIFFALFFGTFVSEDAACLAAGSLVAMGDIGFGLAVAACLTGIFVGDVLLYGVGRAFGGRIIETPLFRRFVSEPSLTKASAWLEEKGAMAIFLSRFVTGLRLPTYLLAGALRTSFPKFAFFFLVAAAIWTPLVVGSAAFAQSAIFSGNLIVGAVILFIGIRLAWKLCGFRSRRLLIGKLKRIVKWEFWPIQVFYIPVFLYVVVLGIKYRCLTLFTCANPAIPAGGFRGESKDKIYKGFSGRANARFLLPHALIPGGLSTEAKIDAARRFISTYRTGFPVVLKPDAGERGAAVKVIRSFKKLCEEISAAKGDIILQQHYSGVEASVFYYRLPNEDRGQIFSITEKRFPMLSGDGRSTIEELILKDGRAVCQAEKYFEQNAYRLGQIPAAGEEVTLTELGTHSRGAVFLDGAWLKTENLERVIDNICREYEGFHFGRFDLRARSFEDLLTGEGLKVIELNGVTSESTNIYDPQYSLIDAYRILFRQWHLAFEIGRQNRDRGVKPAGVAELILSGLGIESSSQKSGTDANAVFHAGNPSL